MFSNKIIDSDRFLDMPQSTQSLYFHLGMRADDDGFINNPKIIMRMVGSSQDDMKILIIKEYILPFESGIVVIKDWKINNYIAKDRYTPTLHTEEMNLLTICDNKSYENMHTKCIQPVYVDKIRLEENRREENRIEEKDPPTPQGKRQQFKPSFTFIENKEWREIWEHWVSNKSSPYRKQVGVETGYKNLLKLSSDDLEEAREIIDQSIGNEWAGLFQLKTNGSGKKEEITMTEIIEKAQKELRAEGKIK